MTFTATRILLADDHPIVRLGLRSLLETCGHYRVAGEAATGDEAVRLALTHRPDLIILDDTLPDISGTEVCRRITRAVDRSRVVMLASYVSKQDLHAARRAGASAYILKQLSSADRLLTVLERVERGDNLFSSHTVAEQLEEIREALGEHPADRLAILSRREQLILCAIAEGLTNRQIGVRLNVTYGSARNAVARLLAKLNVSNRTEAARIAAKNGIVDYTVRQRAADTSRRSVAATDTTA